MSGVIDPLSFMIFDNVFLDTPKPSATSVIDKDRGSK